MESCITAYSSKLNELVGAVEAPAQPTAASRSVAEKSIDLLRTLDRDRTRLNHVVAHLSSQLPTVNIAEVANAYRDLKPRFSQARETLRAHRQEIECLLLQEEQRQRRRAEERRERELRKQKTLAYYEPIIAKLRADGIRETEALTKQQQRQASRKSLITIGWFIIMLSSPSGNACNQWLVDEYLTIRAHKTFLG